MRVLLAAILLVAAALKAHQAATDSLAEKDIFPGWVILQVAFEIFLGIWLLSGFYRRAVWLAALCCFYVFSCVTLYKALSGQHSCGCFGRVAINPWYTLALDIAAVIALMAFRPSANRPATSAPPLLRLRF